MTREQLDDLAVRTLAHLDATIRRSTSTHVLEQQRAQVSSLVRGWYRADYGLAHHQTTPHGCRLGGTAPCLDARRYQAAKLDAWDDLVRIAGVYGVQP